jgi:hypothetical protein
MTDFSEAAWWHVLFYGFCDAVGVMRYGYLVGFWLGWERPLIYYYDSHCNILGTLLLLLIILLY